jgi:uncharacterized protein with beta-barrel porin domain
VPFLSAAWGYDIDIDDSRIVSGFAGAPGSSFSLVGPDIDRSAALVGVGVLFIRDSWNVSLEYLGEFRGDYMANGFFVRAGFAF